jgi:CPA1 family monovalent cation:H+ antiporter
VLSAALEIQEIPEAVLAIATLLAIASFLAVLTRRLQIPLTLILVAVGFLAGELARANNVELPLEGEGFHDVAIFIFLPALVFEAALALPARVFGKNLVPILTLAIVALVISAGLVGLMVHFGLGVSLTAALLFGALISATDPVAVTATFRELGVPNRLLVLVEGESLLNDGIAIVLFEILLLAALGTEEVGVATGLADFLYVFLGGAALGAALGLATAELAARLGRLPSTALTIAVAYGAFALADGILGFSGVMATVTAGLVLSAFSNTLIPRKEAETWEAFWESIGFVANGILFVLIGLVIDAGLIADNLGSIAVGVAAVIVSRPLAIFPVMPLVDRMSRTPNVGLRNQAVVVWGGLRGGVALALALAIPEELPDQERFVAMTAGVVLATLLLNATTIHLLIRRLGLDQPSRLERFVAAAARFDGARTARAELQGSRADGETERQLREIESAAAQEIAHLSLSSDELDQALLRRGLSVERASVEEMVEQELVPQWHARVALNALEDQLDELSVGRASERGLFQASGWGRIVYAIARRIHLGRLTPEKWVDVAYRDLNTRLRATSDAVAALDHFAVCPSVTAQALNEVRERFQGWHGKAERDLEALSRSAPEALLAAAHRRYSSDLGRLASRRELSHLAELGLVSSVAVDHASELIADHLKRAESARIELAIDADEDLGV